MSSEEDLYVRMDKGDLYIEDLSWMSGRLFQSASENAGRLREDLCKLAIGNFVLMEIMFM